MNYILFRRFRQKAICGEVNLPATTECSSNGNYIYYNNKPLCVTASENAHQYFARNDDGQGLLRGKLTQKIQAVLAKPDNQHQSRWDKVWDDDKCQPYRRAEYEDYWLWNDAFFNAPIEDLQYILTLIGGKL